MQLLYRNGPFFNLYRAFTLKLPGRFTIKTQKIYFILNLVLTFNGLIAVNAYKSEMKK